MKKRGLGFLVGAVMLCGRASHTLATPIGLAPLPDGRMSLTGTGSVAAAYSIQAVTNLGAAWTPLATAYAGTNGQFGCVDSEATNYPSRFYRSSPFTAGPLGGGLTAKGTIHLSGGAFLDSYNSAAGPYGPATLGANAIALSNTNVTNAISVNGGYICGYAVTGPGGTVTNSNGASVGDTNWIATGQLGVQPGHAADNANFQFKDVAPPTFPTYYTAFTQSGTTNIAGTPGTTSYYVVSTISSSVISKPLKIYGDVVIYVTKTGNNAVVVSGSGYIDITAGSRLTLYTAGNVIISGSGIPNESGQATACIIYGLPTCTQFTYSGSADFIGVVYAPGASFTFSGSEKACGAFIANNITVSGSGGVHYDEALGN